MASLLLNDLKINYFDNGLASDEVILFIHGNSQSLNSFRHQLSNPGLNQYRLIALDLPGHGNSQKANDYHIDLFVNVLSSLIDSLNIKQYLVVGHSLGGHIALQSLHQLNPRGILVFGAPPLTQPLDLTAFKAHEHLPLLFQNDLSASDAENLIRMFYQRPEVPAEDTLDLERTDKDFRAAMFKSFSEGKYQDEVKLLNKYSGHKAIIAGLDDKLVNLSYIKNSVNPEDLWQKRIIELPSSHNMHIEAHTDFNNLLMAYAEEVF
jgi:pimeloyl-ACP methyl ester carboxylesterase